MNPYYWLTIQGMEPGMNEVKLNELIRIGQLLRYIEDYAEGCFATWMKGVRGKKIGLIDSLTLIRETIDELGICPGTSKEIQKFIDKTEKKYPAAESDLSPEDRKLLQEYRNLWYDRIINESKNLNVVLLNNEYSLNPALLIKGAEHFFNENIWKKLTKTTQRDLDEATRCILFELPTPAGILALRATESVLRRYYKRKTNNAITGFIDWKTIIDHLRNTNADTTLLGHLDYLRYNLRNRLNHPDAILAQKEAENIFPMIVTSVEAMIKDF